jgi:hypothetical protein
MAYPPAEDFRDDFTETSLNTGKWTAGGATGGVAVVSDQLVLTPDTSGNAAFVTSGDYDLTSSHFDVQIAGLSSNVTTAWVQILNSSLGAAAGFAVTESGKTARTFTNIPGTGLVYGDYALTGSQVGWLRIRELEGTLYWEWSADGSSWAVVDSAANPFDLTAAQFQLMALSSSGVTWSATFDNCNILDG